MPASSLYETRLAELDRGISTYEARITALEKEKRLSSKTARRARARLSYLLFVRWLRKPARDYTLWRPGLVLVGAASAAVVSFIVLDKFSGTSTIVYGGCITGAVATSAAIL